MLDPIKILKKTEELMKKYNIPKENISADRQTLRWLFLREL